METVSQVLIETWQQGNEEAVHRLFALYYPRSVRIAILSGLTPEDGEDCAQEAFLVAFEHRSQLRNPATFPAWFHRILTNHIIDCLRKQQYIQRKDQNAISQLTNLWEHERSCFPDEIAIKEEKRVQLWLCIQSLEPDYRIPLVLRYYGDFSFREIAIIVNKREGTIRVIIHRALRRLRLFLSNEDLEKRDIFPLIRQEEMFKKEIMS